jgi:osmotically-inducible protein OsmY
MQARSLILAALVAVAAGGCSTMSRPDDADGDRNTGASASTDRNRTGSWSTPDESLHDRVHDALMEQMGPAVNDVGVTVKGSAVTLTGSVKSEADKQKAHDIAHGVSGAGSVDISALVVKP